MIALETDDDGSLVRVHELLFLRIVRNGGSDETEGDEGEYCKETEEEEEDGSVAVPAVVDIGSHMQDLHQVARNQVAECLGEMQFANHTLPNMYTARKKPDFLPRSLSFEFSPSRTP